MIWVSWAISLGVLFLRTNFQTFVLIRVCVDCSLAAYAAKKAKKPQIIAKSNIILDVKPWDDETDMDALERSVRSIEMDGLLWGACEYSTITSL